MRVPYAFFGLVVLFATALAGCANDNDKFMREPSLSPVGSGLATRTNSAIDEFPSDANHSHTVFDGGAADLYKDQRITKVGDIVTVKIAINDKATFGNSTDRSQTANSNFTLDWGLSLASAGSSSSSTPSTLTAGAQSTSTNQGQGNIDRSEQIQVEVAAIVTAVLPNGNLVISGSQEVRVNYELRDLTVAGIVRPWDISKDNTIAYDRIAEARISYGGRGRLTDVQQPGWGQQLTDKVKPF
jgi:flagellar L-ring protein precursor FlgH